MPPAGSSSDRLRPLPSPLPGIAAAFAAWEAGAARTESVPVPIGARQHLAVEGGHHFRLRRNGVHLAGEGPRQIPHEGYVLREAGQIDVDLGEHLEMLRLCRGRELPDRACVLL